MKGKFISFDDQIYRQRKTIRKYHKISNNETPGSPATIEAAKFMHEWNDNNICSVNAVVIYNNLQTQIIKRTFKSKAEVFTEPVKVRLKAHKKTIMLNQKQFAFSPMSLIILPLNKRCYLKTRAVEAHNKKKEK